MNTQEEKDIIRAWAKLCPLVGANTPRSLRPKYILETWCPEGTVDQKMRDERRPELREIIEKSLNRTLSTDDISGFYEFDSNHIYFKQLWSEVHGDIDMAGKNDFVSWAEGKIKSLDDDIWDALDHEHLSQLTVAFLKFNFMSKSIESQIEAQERWASEYKSKFERLENLVSENPEYYSEEHEEKLHLAGGRIEEINTISEGYQQMIDAAEHQLAKITADLLFHSHDVSGDLPEFIENISIDIVEQNTKMFQSLLSIGINDPEGEQDRISRKVSELFENVQIHRDKLDYEIEIIYRLLKQITDLGD